MEHPIQFDQLAPQRSDLNFNPARPRLQIIRGLPGTGKSTIAKHYPCLHLELDQFCCREGAYRWGEQRNREGDEWLNVTAHRLMKEGMDLVIAGVLPELRKRLGWLVYWGMKCNYDVWVADLAEIKGNGNIHGVRMDDLSYMERTFQPFSLEAMAHVNKYGHRPDDVRMSDNEYIAFGNYVMEHVHVGFMPNDYPNEPEIDGMGV